MKAIKKKHLRRVRRKRHIRKAVTGTPERPRLTVFRSHKHIYAQIINDEEGKTLAASSTKAKDLSDKPANGGNRAAAALVGTALAAKAVEAGIKKVVFDRNGFVYHGRVRELAEAARKGGLDF